MSISSISRAAAVVALVALTLAPAARAQAPAQPEAASGRSDKTLVTARRAVVATANPVASQVGADILAAGGSAADAAIAIQLALTLVEPQSSGLGGGAFALYWAEGRRRLTTFDGRETAPGGAAPDMFLDPDGKPIPFIDGVLGGRAVGVPGTPRLIEALHRKHGRLPWARLFDPVIRLAEQGFAMSPRLVTLLAQEKALRNDPVAAAYFYQPDGTPKPVGTVLRNPDLAATLKTLQRQGADAFYRGAIAQDILSRVSQPPRPSSMTAEDLAGYRVKERPAVCGPYRGFEVCGMGPPSSGGVAVVQMLGLLERFDLRATGAGTLASVHLFTQAHRLAFADRNRYLADPDFVPQPVAGLLARGYLAQRAALIDPVRDMGTAQPGDPARRRAALADDASPELPSTSHLIVVDRWGDAVSMTTTIEDAFGARRMVAGFLLNNEMTDFSFLPAQGGQPVANRVEAGKRPRSSMAPTMVFGPDRRLVMLVGSPGGSQIIGYVAQTLVGLIDWGQDPQAAVSAGHYGNPNGPTLLERGTPAADLADGLKAMGHADVRIVDMTSGLSAVRRDGQMWQAGVDPRREGRAIGF